MMRSLVLLIRGDKLKGTAMKVSRRELLQSSAGVALAGATTQRSASASNKPKGEWRGRSGKRPNIVIAVLDDVGFGDFGCYGSEVATPGFDTLAKNGVRYNNFHVTAVCAPTRACMLTGRNAHAVGVGNIAEWGRPLPGYRGYIREDVTLLPEVLGDAGYSTLAIGKWHLSMVHDQDAMGPFDFWPTQRGFDHWYGFHGSAVDHFHPELFKNTAEVYADKSGDYHLTEDLVDQSINYVADHIATAPDRPFFMYLAFGACHFPFHAPKEYLEKYRGKYDAGWDGFRAARFDRQKELGIAPKESVMSPHGPNVPNWNDLSSDEKKFSARTMEAYAAMLDHTDAHFNRFVEFLRREDELDNTIIILMSDNGAPKGRHRAGAVDVRRVAYINDETVEHMASQIDKIGGEESSCTYSAGWSQLSNTPLKYHKGDTYEGGIRAPFIIHWPDGDIAAGAINNQYHHVTDLMPTLLEVIGEPAPHEKDKLAEPFDGVSMAYGLGAPAAATTKTIQHYETAGDRAIWVDGWKAVALHQRGKAFEDDEWALYHAAEDFAETNNLADQHPERLEKMKALWRREAERNDVLPLDDDLDGLYAKIAPEPRAEYIFYPGATRLNRLSAPDIYGHDFEMVATVDLENSKANGIVLASGDSAAGYELVMHKGVLTFIYIFTRENRHEFKASRRVPAGRHKIGLRGRARSRDGKDLELFIGDETVGRMTLPQMWEVQALNAGIRCGQNHGAPIGFSYKGANEFDQGLEKVVVRLKLNG